MQCNLLGHLTAAPPAQNHLPAHVWQEETPRLLLISLKHQIPARRDSRSITVLVCRCKERGWVRHPLRLSSNWKKIWSGLFGTFIAGMLLEGELPSSGCVTAAWIRSG